MNSKTIARNTAWYGLENLIGFVTTLITSIAIARTLGPAKMGYIIYITWLIGIVSSLGSVGLPETTRKYMAEFVGGGDLSTARFIYLRTFVMQTGLASVATLGAVLWVLHDSPAEYRVAALLLVCGILPAMSNFISAQANVASENLSANLPASLAATATYFALTLTAIFLNWGVTGIAFAMFSMRVVDFVVRLIPTMRRILSWDTGEVHPPTDLRARMMSFATQSVMGMLLTLVVWDRSEVFLLKHLSPDIRQVSFYSVSFGLAERLLLFPSIFGAAAGASILAQYGRDRSRLPALTAASLRYIALISIPLHVIAVPLAAPALLTLYGKQYLGAAVVATVAPLLCLPKAFLGLIQSLFESVDKQKYFLIATVIASFVDIGVAWSLIPRYGALGACIGSGAAQIVAVGMMWAIGIQRYRIQLPWGFLARLTAISVVASVAAWGVSRHLAVLPALITGCIIATTVFMTLAYLFKILEPEDGSRFKVIANACPKALSGPMNTMIDWFTRMEPSSTIA
ncbi:MAG: polysaccharide biosynthesis C-terminal domain-containing protein [Edaphobacter sp.]|uniref:oligosaccharide flippase family protein n=1 Tax=Edaphobacter sp. TaxID=1934404 RepID=UPI002399AA85|nr:polysaccharide biosynthesis C-terminal domain-containing protein [Edaphobacter sp.]MDE1178109.1 polysaccharide biosynthesis C-terminal domain-containing protein [Edaphobacter sp.]